MATGQAERLMPLLEDLLAAAGIGWRDLSTLAVGTGPGNFTGVRIAVAAARGLALALGVPAVGVTLFEARAHGLPRPLRVIEDARRGMVYLQDFPATGANSPARLAEAGALPPWSGAVAGSAAQPGAALSPAMPLAEAIARVAAARIDAARIDAARTAGGQEGLAQPRPAPFYLRGADAAPPSDPPPVILP